MFISIKERYYRWRVKEAVRLLSNLDRLMKKAGYKRSARRQFWREFNKSELKNEMLNRLLGLK